jgi:hypothetical protein
VPSSGATLTAVENAGSPTAIVGAHRPNYEQNNQKGGTDMHFSILAQPVAALIAGILILLVPRLLSYIVAVYLIIFGILGLIH